MKVRFRYFPFDASRNWWLQLLEEALGERFQIVEDEGKRVDLSITGPYYGDIGDYVTPLRVRVQRLAEMKFSHGQQLISRKLASGIRPDENAKVNFWFTGENERPPFGEWSAYFGFDYHFQSKNYAYLPLWFLTSTNLMSDTKTSYWGSSIPATENLLKERTLTTIAKKFACAFVGKAYPLRLHALESISSVGEIDIFGPATRNPVDKPSDLAKEYKFTFCFENDIYPGYVTEKPLEAYLAGTVPIYYGHDAAGFLNEESMLNLFSYPNFSSWIEQIRCVNSSETLYREYYQKPILKRNPDLSKVLDVIRAAFS